MGVVLFVDEGRQDGIHDGVPHNWFGQVAEECPLGASQGVATEVADRVDTPRSIVGSEVDREGREAARISRREGRRSRRSGTLPLLGS